MDSGKSLWLQILPVVVFLLCSSSALESNDVNCDVESDEGCNEIHHAHMYSSQANKEGNQDVYDSLWDNNVDIAMQTMNTPFMDHMKVGDLQSDDYVNFMIQDINYLVKVTEMLKQMSDKVKTPEDLKTFFSDRYKRYNNFATDILKQFNFNGAPLIKPIPAMEKYLSDYKKIMEEEKPIFFAVSLLPCSRLWLWLADTLPINASNAYYIWKKNNMGGHPEKHYRKLLDDNLKTKKDIEQANNIFRQQMQNEFNFFAASRKP